MSLITSEGLDSQQAHLYGVDLPEETKLLFARMLCFQHSISDEPTNGFCELDGRYVRPAESLVNAEMVKKAEEKVRIRYEITLDRMRTLCGKKQAAVENVITQRHIYEAYDKAKLQKQIRRAQILQMLQGFRRELYRVVTFPPDGGKTLLPPHPITTNSPHPTPNPSPIKGEGSKANMPIEEAVEIAKEVASLLKSHCEQIKIAGSIRRGKAVIGDIELVAIPKGKELWDCLDRMLLEGKITKAVYGVKNGKPQYRWGGDKYRGFMWKGIKVEVFLADAKNWGYQYLLRTGPGEANTAIMTVVKNRKAPFSFKDGRVWNADGKEIPVPEEKDVFALLGMEYVAAEKRSPHVYWKAFNRVGHEWGVQVSER